MKQILIKSCRECPYRKLHWSKPSGNIFEGYSCSHERPIDIFISSYDISKCVDQVHKNCPLKDV